MKSDENLSNTIVVCIFWGDAFVHTRTFDVHSCHLHTMKYLLATDQFLKWLVEITSVQTGKHDWNWSSPDGLC